MRQPMTDTTVVPSEPPTKEDIEINRKKAIWKKDDMNQARKFRNQTEIQYCNAFNWKSTFVPEIQRTAEEQAQHTDRIEDKYLQHQISNAPRENKKHRTRILRVGTSKKSNYTYSNSNKTIMLNLIFTLRKSIKPQFYSLRKTSLHCRAWP